jgi:hypothetical protein
VITLSLEGGLLGLIEAAGLNGHGQILRSLVGAKLRTAEKWARRIGWRSHQSH